ncbi:MAG: CBS domain-containing protein [Armatimonadota bacterium]|nr:CBS domain-containing protein [Armatimonadota bacterium]MDR7486286.1 CBS domain-containing protein [Armatimonadota bacterium]MDR7532261.1 CBS domain-containing protein [Armatimonadota bacterium]MDR7537266.1 CBS domain-containing protein [Armatimonadota bacterium]
MLVRDCMTPDPTTVAPQTSLGDALRVMRRQRIRHLPVMERDRLVGIVTWTDLMRASPSPASGLAAWEIPELLAQAPVRDVMTEHPVTVAPDLPVEDAARLLRERKIGSLPVVDGDRLVGIVTESDLFDALVRLLGGDIGGVRMAVDLPAGLVDVDRLIHALEGVRGKTPTVVIAVRLDQATRRGYVRLSTATPLQVAEALAAEGFHVTQLKVSPRPRPDAPQDLTVQRADPTTAPGHP